MSAWVRTDHYVDVCVLPELCDCADCTHRLCMLQERYIHLLEWSVGSGKHDCNTSMTGTMGIPEWERNSQRTRKVEYLVNPSYCNSRLGKTTWDWLGWHGFHSTAIQASSQSDLPWASVYPQGRPVSFGLYRWSQGQSTSWREGAKLKLCPWHPLVATNTCLLSNGNW